ncbi:class I SAM-dependent methyltransferase [Roseomonas sp. BN140053]|uniref:class I SAM-dependent methyltransferase n=1 Tax=Roseomonas sp. BN140053 TaxID=3391898 RepID=UPI0039E9C722
MHAEVHGLDAFYASPTGVVAKRLLRLRLRAIWPELAGQEVLGIGHAGPYLRLWRRRAARLVSAVPAQLGTATGGPMLPWPPDGPCAATLVEEDALPFPDLSFDAVLMVHGLENAGDTRRLLRDAWRVLRDEGRLLAVVPNRRSVWAHLERTPLGHGQPYSPGQLARLLERSLFRVERREGALFIPPFRARALLGGARAWEAVGRAVAPNLAGVTIIEARKEVFGAMPAAPVRARRVTRPVAAFAAGQVGALAPGQDRRPAKRAPPCRASPAASPP